MDFALKLKNNNRVCISTTGQNRRNVVNDDLSFHFIFSGNEKFVFKKRRLRVFPDSFLAVKPGTDYLEEVDSPYPVRMMTLCFDDGFIKDFERFYLNDDTYLLDNFSKLGREKLVINETIYPFAGDIKYNIDHLNHLISNYQDDDLLVNEYLYHTLLNYHAIYNKEAARISEGLEKLQKGTREEIGRRLNLAKEYLYSNYDQKISLQELAEYSCLSVTHLIRSFRQAYHLTPHQFLMRIRLSRAKFLLDDTAYPINEVVNIVGLDSTSTFIKVFKEHFQTTPLRYRRSVS